MQPELIALVLAAAFLHGCWGAAGRASRDPVMAGTLGAVVPALVAAAMALRGVTAPAEAAWPWLAASVGLHLAYLVALVLAWRFVALTQAYPLARAGVAPIAALFAVLWIGQPLGWFAMAGIAMIAAAVFVLALHPALLSRRGAAGIALAFAASALLGAATAADFIGLHRADSTLGYIVWVNLLEGAVAAPLVLLIRKRPFGALPLREFPLQVATALAAAASYAMVLWALSLAPLAPVAALRETQAVFAALIGAAFLGERLGTRGGVAMVLAALGAVIVAFA